MQGPHSKPSLRFIQSILLLMVLPFLFQCAKEEDPYGGTLVLSSFREPYGLNPIFNLDTVSTNLNSMIFNSLFVLDENLEYIPDLAESWQVSEDGLTWDVRLRRGVLFHDGEELDAEDVVFTFQTILNPDTGSPLAPMFHIIDSVEVTSGYEVRFVLKERYAPFLYLLIAEIVPAHVFQDWGETFAEFGRAPIGTGPFKFDNWHSGEITLVANEAYFEGRPFLDKVAVRALPDKRKAWSELMQGKVDVAMDLGFEDYRIIENDPRFQTYDYAGVFYYTLLFNLRDPLFADERLRQALDLAVDRNEIISGALHGWADETTGPFRPGTWPYNPEVPASRCDPEAARAILSGLGWKDVDGDLILEKEGEELGFTLLVDHGDLLKEAVAQRIKWQLFKIGVRLEVELLEQQELFRKRLFPGRFQAVLLQLNAGVDPDKYTGFFWHSRRIGSSNLGAYENPQVDRLIDLGRITQEFEKRREIYHRIHTLIAGDRPALFLFVRRVFFGVSSRFEGIRATPESFFHSVKDWRMIKTKEERR
jgi:peptide/nickel transport system substrate-binding protein